MQDDLALKSALHPRTGVVVDPQEGAATWKTGAVLEVTLDALWARRALRDIEYPGPSQDPLLAAFKGPSGNAEFGFILRPVPRNVPAPSVIDRLCQLLSRFMVQEVFPAEVFAETALALRSAFGEPPPAHASPAAHRGLAKWQEQQAIDYIDGRLGETFTTADVAATCGMSAGRFASAFRLSLGAPLRQWVINRRIERAQSMLGRESMTLGDVAVACGFSEQCHFTRQFARIVGMPPGAWRRQLQTVGA